MNFDSYLEAVSTNYPLLNYGISVFENMSDDDDITQKLSIKLGTSSQHL